MIAGSMQACFALFRMSQDGGRLVRFGPKRGGTRRHSDNVRGGHNGRVPKPSPAEGPGRRALLRLRRRGSCGSTRCHGTGRLATWPTHRLPDTMANPPICRVAGDVAAIAPGSVPRELTITWNTNAVCNVGVAVADAQGFFAKRNLKVEKINFAGATDQLLELLASGKADAGVGMALAWMKPLEQGFDVKLTAAIHGGCIRLITTREFGHHRASRR